MLIIMLWNIDQWVSLSQQPAKITKLNYDKIKIKDLRAKELKAKF